LLLPVRQDRVDRLLQLRAVEGSVSGHRLQVALHTDHGRSVLREVKVRRFHLEHVHQDLVEVDLRVVSVMDSGGFGDYAFLARGRGKVGCRGLGGCWSGWLGSDAKCMTLEI